MTTPINDGGPAFPVPMIPLPNSGGGYTSVEHGGASLRDWFASQAVEEDIQAAFSLMNLSAESSGRVTRRWEARYLHADKMIDARKVTR